MESNRRRQIKMRHLSAFVETVRCGSLKAASERTFLTRPAISKTLSVAADLLADVVLRFAELSLATLVTAEDGCIGAWVDRLRSGDLDLVVGRMGRPEAMAGPLGILVRSEEDPTPTIRLFRQSLLEARKCAEVR